MSWVQILQVFFVLSFFRSLCGDTTPQGGGTFIIKGALQCRAKQLRKERINFIFTIVAYSLTF